MGKAAEQILLLFFYLLVTISNVQADREVIIFAERMVTAVNVKFEEKGGVQMTAEREVNISAQEAAHGEKT